MSPIISGGMPDSMARGMTCGIDQSMGNVHCLSWHRHVWQGMLHVCNIECCRHHAYMCAACWTQKFCALQKYGKKLSWADLMILAGVCNMSRMQHDATPCNA